MSKLYFRYGAMNSGKSTNLMQVAMQKYNIDCILVDEGAYN